MPVISVIVPVYNTEQYLPHCLNSIITQSMSDIEIICVNDGKKTGVYVANIKVVLQTTV